MAFAPNYHRWILDRFRPYLGRRVAEIGAGSGNFARLLLGERIESLHLVEPSSAMFQHLPALAMSDPAGRVALHNAVFLAVRQQLRAAEIDSLVYVNVLEHIVEDDGELHGMNEVLQPGGRIFIFVPAFYFDIGGIVPWWLKYCLFRSTRMEPGAVHLYDRMIVPIMSRLEAWLPPPLGKNVILVAEKVN